MGPNYFNFEAICQQLQEAGGMLIVSDVNELVSQMEGLLADAGKIEQMGKNAGEVVLAGRGAVERVVKRILPLVSDAP